MIAGSAAATEPPAATSILFEGGPVLGNLSLDDPAWPFTRRSLRYSSRRVLRRIREALGDDEAYLPIVLRATPTGTVRRLTDETEVVIEGFPRSGNTFAFFALKHAAGLAGRDIVISSHVHTPSAVKASVRLRYPTLYVIREPLDTVVSLLIAAPHVPFDAAIREWIHHHREIIPYQAGYVLATFREVTTDFGAVTQRVNERFATELPVFVPSPASIEAVFGAIDHNHEVLHGGTENVVPRPSTLRAAEKNWLIEQLRARAYTAMLAEADGLYSEFAALSAS